jgi:hypothetical protein
LKSHDLILFDPRGVGYSQPKMDCPPDEDSNASTQQRPLSLVRHSDSSIYLASFLRWIRRVVFDSVIPPQVDRIGGDLTSTGASFSVLFSACKADLVCDRDYPELETQFIELVQRLDAEPLRITVPDPETGKKKQVWVTGGSVAGGLEEIMKRSYMLRLAPLAISRIHDGDRNLVENLYAGLASTGNPANYITVICRDTGALFDAETFQAQVEKRHSSFEP